MSGSPSAPVPVFGVDTGKTIADRAGAWLSGWAVRRAVPLAGARVADLGCGYDAAFMRTQLASVAAATLVDIDLAPDLDAHLNVTALRGTLPDVLAGIPSASLDVVLCLAVLEHLWEPEAVVAEARRILVPGGALVVNVPTWRGRVVLETTGFRMRMPWGPSIDDHKAYYDPRDLWLLLRRGGFRPSLIRCRRHKLGFAAFAVARTDPADGST